MVLRKEIFYMASVREGMLTTTQFAEAIGVSVPTLYNWQKAGTLIPFKISPTGRRYYTKEQVAKIKQMGVVTNYKKG